MTAHVEHAQAGSIWYDSPCLSRMVPVTMAQLESRGVRVPAFNGERGDHPCDARTPRDFCVLISGFTRPTPVRMVLGVEMKHTKPGASLHDARERTTKDQRLIDGIHEEQRAKDMLRAAALQFATSVRKNSMAVANWSDGQGGYALEAARSALIAAGVFREPVSAPKDGRRKIPARVRMSVHERSGYRCVACGSHLKLTIDHIKPLSLGGGDEVENLQTMCMPCNAKKGAKA